LVLKRIVAPALAHGLLLAWADTSAETMPLPKNNRHT
jgi:hypothetical protein